jgi:3-hydroxybutyryl-CoA dehydrogenase
LSGIEEVLVVGAGVMGREIAVQCAMFGYRVTVYDVSAEALKAGRAIIDIAARNVSGTVVSETPAAITGRIYFTDDLEEAAASADLVSESIPEDAELKGDLFARLNALAPPHTIFTTNSSSLVPSMFAARSGRPDRLLALHFHKTVWISNIVDVMPHAGTNPALVPVVAAFARSIRQIPIVLRQESRGYVFNAMLRGYLSAAFKLWSDGVASIEDIDRAWMVAHQSPIGPFGAMDSIGLDVMGDIMEAWRQEDDSAREQSIIQAFRRDFVERGRLGAKSGRGFYTYPNPAFLDAAFLNPSPEGDAAGAQADPAPASDGASNRSRISDSRRTS